MESPQGRSLTESSGGKPGPIPELRSRQPAVYLVSHTRGQKHSEAY